MSHPLGNAAAGRVPIVGSRRAIVVQLFVTYVVDPAVPPEALGGDLLERLHVPVGLVGQLAHVVTKEMPWPQFEAFMAKVQAGGTGAAGPTPEGPPRA